MALGWPGPVGLGLAGLGLAWSDWAVAGVGWAGWAGADLAVAVLGWQKLHVALIRKLGRPSYGNWAASHSET